MLSNPPQRPRFEMHRVAQRVGIDPSPFTFLTEFLTRGNRPGGFPGMVHVFVDGFGEGLNGRSADRSAKLCFAAEARIVDVVVAAGVGLDANGHIGGIPGGWAPPAAAPFINPAA